MTNTFPLLSLPYLCQKNVIDCWNPFEFFTFARLSQRTMRIATFIKKRIPYIVVYCPSLAGEYCLEMKAPGEDSWISWKFCSLNHWDKDYRRPNKYVIRSSDEFLGLLDLTRDILKIFKTSNNKISMRLNRRVTRDQISSFIDFANSLKRNPEDTEFLFEMNTCNGPLLQQTMNGLSKNVKNITIFSYDTRDFSIDLPKFKVMNRLDVWGKCRWVNLKFLLQVDPIRIYMEHKTWTSRELNRLLKCWIEGKMRLKQCEIYFKQQIDIKEILIGLHAELMDPRIHVKSLQIDVGYRIKTTRVYGGIYLNRNDGRRIVITHFGHKEHRNGEGVPQKVIDEYEKAVRTWNERGVSRVYPTYKLCMYSE
ncbi:unnamed protein product [Caenorhabditis brenneri]